jgi:hypothetical protein
LDSHLRRKECQSQLAEAGLLAELPLADCLTQSSHSLNLPLVLQEQVHLSERIKQLLKTFQLEPQLNIFVMLKFGILLVATTQ